MPCSSTNMNSLSWNGFIQQNYFNLTFINIKIQEINQCVQFVNFSRDLFMNTLLTASHNSNRKYCYSKFTWRSNLWQNLFLGLNHDLFTCKYMSNSLLKYWYPHANMSAKCCQCVRKDYIWNWCQNSKAGAIFSPAGGFRIYKDLRWTLERLCGGILAATADLVWTLDTLAAKGRHQ